MQFTDPALLNRALEYSVSSKVRNQDSAIQLSIPLQIPESRDQAWSFIKTHWDAVQAQFTTEMGSLLVSYVGGFCSADARDDVKSFFAGHPVAAADVALRHSIEHINGCIELRRLQEPNLKTWLAAQARELGSDFGASRDDLRARAAARKRRRAPRPAWQSRSAAGFRRGRDGKMPNRRPRPHPWRAIDDGLFQQRSCQAAARRWP